ncbi:galactose-specific lectin nattectin-like isoform X2 [Neolamprologus brichardi]|uniref:galactose-specific lectin nattectin-like isoform X1 n=1 Tax=Neolamprologus brichardi TaxID=32507 RepID=UPI0003EC3B59|nr:galactose-specific lectin nattectin-like isoform X1 [Neolamprologus brichardi]XP_035762450.1 galactose-specific lectin nattectin-like isoform X2 [Neolamprologus brichardi]
MILLLFLFSLALGAPSESHSDGSEVKLQLDDHRVELRQGSCPLFWFSFNGRCYKYVATQMSWADAELYCVSQRANLVSIHSREEEQFVKLLIKNFDHAEGWTWIGLSDLHKEGRWMWSDGCAVSFTYWSAGQPDNAGTVEHCVHTNFEAKMWNDNPCSFNLASVCATQITCP